MVAVGFLVVLGAYGVGLSGYSLIRGYNNALGSLWNPVKPAKWTTQCYTGTAVLPSGSSADSGPCGSGSNSGGGAIANQAANEANSAASNVTGGAVGSQGTSQPGSTPGSLGGIGGTGIR
jgi:hypothetical protein